MNPLTTLYRPVGQAELDLIKIGGFRKFPPRLPDQPFFYPVLAEEPQPKLRVTGIRKTSDQVLQGTCCVFKFKPNSSTVMKFVSLEVQNIANTGFPPPSWRNSMPALSASLK